MVKNGSDFKVWSLVAYYRCFIIDKNNIDLFVIIIVRGTAVDDL